MFNQTLYPLMVSILLDQPMIFFNLSSILMINDQNLQIFLITSIISNSTFNSI